MNKAEKFIINDARSLPVSECFITGSWEKDGMANVTVSREHENGHKTVGFFLVDLFCLGIKDTWYIFDVPDYKYEEIVESVLSGGGMDCDYELAHNVIYGAFQYAKNLGFLPGEEWEITRFILEGEDAPIPSVDIDFGLNGEPCYVAGPDDDDEFREQVILALEKSVGPDRYSVIVPEDELEEDEFFDLDEMWGFDEDDFDEEDFGEEGYDEEDWD